MDMNICAQNLPVCNSGRHTYITGLFNFFFVLQDLIDRIDSYFQRIDFQRDFQRPVGMGYGGLHSFFGGVGLILWCRGADYPWGGRNNTFTWLSLLCNPFKTFGNSCIPCL